MKKGHFMDKSQFKRGLHDQTEVELDIYNLLFVQNKDYQYSASHLVILSFNDTSLIIFRKRQHDVSIITKNNNKYSTRGQLVPFGMYTICLYYCNQSKFAVQIA